ncbi:hypothetical protein BC829DRAFT_379368 [Chytridium lagenaria]|nr:hypothetical protein BC829DRAFT_379368 [Chytridium lagenaria]
MGTQVWEERWSKSKNRAYFFNRETNESVWELPAGASAAPREAPDEVRASHILVKHRDCRRPASWRMDPITRTKEEAHGIIQGYLAQLSSGQIDFAALAKTESDCSSAKQGGDLGYFGRGKMMPSFEKATMALRVGEMSGPVESDSGVHIILRTA